MCSSSETVGRFPPCVSQPLARSPSTLYSGRHSKLGGLSQRGRGRVGTGAAASLPTPHTRVSGGRNGGARHEGWPPGGLTFWRSVCSCFSITSSWYTLPVRSRGGSSLERQGQGETQGPPAPREGSGGTGGTGHSCPRSSGESFPCWGPEGCLEGGSGEARASFHICGCGRGGCGSLWEAVHAPALTCASPAGPEPRVCFRCERLTQSKTRTRLTDTSTEHLAGLGTVSATGH